MPELPEVETVKRGLQKVLIGKSIKNVHVYWPRTVGGDSKKFSSQIKGQKIQSIFRHGKKIYFQFPKHIMSVHLRMTGQLRIHKNHPKPNAHTRVILELDNPKTLLFFEDIRKFGRMVIDKPPLKTNPDTWLASHHDVFNAIRRKTGYIKHALLNQNVVSGLGNIYVDEVLFRTKIHPLSKLEKINDEKLNLLVKNMKDILGKAISIGGTSFRNYVDTNGVRGGFKTWLKVYNQHGQKCSCGTVIRKTLVAQRGTHFCPRCQRKK